MRSQVEPVLPLIFRRRDVGEVKISLFALQRMQKYRQSQPHRLEAGGVLLGRFIADTSDVVIDEVTTPMRWDKRGRFFFQRSQCGHQAYIDEAWEESGGTCTYLGEWHTHPEPHPTPSSVDTSDWRRKLREDVYEGASLFFLIFGVDEVRLWEGFRTHRKIYRLTMLAR